ncbi:Hypothetical protein I595_3120 [Croceitalea dokdonensis DOKDO 023]|uniref:Uncharacterized protein n=1 Tax=Croceitalea dokdonensis DOKDO 023 TaxID=1300341 RepID=A0A0P7ART5_9FLAO|nr:Hypothetical protein I595_3120 [Croceitalea dokdonensis DOKDO 023]
MNNLFLSVLITNEFCLETVLHAFYSNKKAMKLNKLMAFFDVGISSYFI